MTNQYPDDDLTGLYEPAPGFKEIDTDPDEDLDGDFPDPQDD